MFSKCAFVHTRRRCGGIIPFFLVLDYLPCLVIDVRYTVDIGVARGLQWVHLHPQGAENFFRRNLQRKFVHVRAFPSTPRAPQAEHESVFRTFLLCGENLELQLVVLDRLLKATTKKGRQLFEEKSAPPDKILHAI